MAGLDLAGVIGTWVAVGIGLVALIGIAGPLLILYATRTERNKALEKIIDPESRHISRGLPVTRSHRLFRRVRAPVVQKPPEPSVSPLSFDQKSKDSYHGVLSCGWIEFADLLDAYMKPPSVGNSLQIYSGTAYLPVHRAWLLAIGLLGRYGHREDKGQRGRFKTSAFNRKSLTPVPMGEFAISRDETVSRSDDTSDTELRHLREMAGFRITYGITGAFRLASSKTLRGLESRNIVEFEQISDRGLVIEADTMPLKMLYMLAVGCLPLKEGHYMWINEDVKEESDTSSEASASSSDGIGDYVTPPGHTVTYDEDSDTRRRERSRQSQAVRARRRKRPFRSKAVSTSKNITAFRSEDIDDAHVHMSIIKSFFGDDTAHLRRFAQVRLSEAERKRLGSLQFKTFVPADCEWVRLDDSDGARRDAYFLRRDDAQIFAQSVMRLKWHSESYLLGQSSVNIDIMLLESASKSLFPLLAYASQAIHLLGFPTGDQKDVLEAIDSLYRLLEKDRGGSRSLYASQYRVEKLLQRLHRGIEPFHEMIAVLTISNNEFALLIRETARYLYQGVPAASVNIDVKSGQLKIPAAFGVERAFYIDNKEAYPNLPVDRDVVQVPFVSAFLSAVQATLRCHMVRSCTHSGPLLGDISNMDDIVLFS